MMAMMMGVFAVLLVAVPGVTAHGILTTPAPRDGTQIAGGNKGESSGRPVVGRG
jgi:methionine-rich copper-binding protein CopC